MTVTFQRPYAGNAAGDVRDLSAELEAALIAQGIAVNGGTLTTGAQTPTSSTSPGLPVLAGIANVAVGASSVTITNSAITATSKAFASISQAAADATLTSIVRAHCTAGVLTITGNANATASTRIAYLVTN